jgi:hypothetical protein
VRRVQKWMNQDVVDALEERYKFLEQRSFPDDPQWTHDGLVWIGREKVTYPPKNKLGSMSPAAVPDGVCPSLW